MTRPRIPHGLEWFLTSILFGWGFVLAWPGDSFDRPGLAGFRMYAPEHYWMVACFAIAAIRTVALFVNGSRGLSAVVRAGVAFLSSGFFTVLTFAYLKAGLTTLPPALAVYPSAMLFELVIFFNAMREVGQWGGVVAACRRRRDVVA